MLHWMTRMLSHSYELLTNSTAISLPRLVLSGRSSHLAKPFDCSSANISLLSVLSANAPTSQSFLPRNSACVYPSISMR